MNVGSNKMKLVVIEDTSSLQQRNVSKKNTSVGDGISPQELNYPRDNASASNTTSVLPLPKQINIVYIFTLIGCIIRLKSLEYGDFNNETNPFDNDFKLKYEFESDFDCDVLSSPTIGTMDTSGVTSAPAFNFSATGVALREFDILGCNVCAISSTPIVVTQGIKNENENEMIPKSGSLCVIHIHKHNTQPHQQLTLLTK